MSWQRTAAVLGLIAAAVALAFLEQVALAGSALGAAIATVIPSGTSLPDPTKK